MDYYHPKQKKNKNTTSSSMSPSSSSSGIPLMYIKACNKVVKPSPLYSYYAWNTALCVLLLFAATNIYSTSKSIVREIRNNIIATTTTTSNLRRLAPNYYNDYYKASLYHVQIVNNTTRRSSGDKKDTAAATTTTPNLYEMMGSPTVCFRHNCTTKENICNLKPKQKVLSKNIWFQTPPPVITSNEDVVGEVNDQHRHRLIPRIIHQSWFKDVEEEEHPNLSRIQNSWKSIGGWEYRFYNDDDAANFIREHFPLEFFQAYDALIPGAFKADFFRYCVLFIEGGVWADIDMQLQINLDRFISDDDGFIVPRDIGGHALHNALMMSAPGHPILAKALEETTNMIRNRYTVIDIAGRYCPNVNNDIMKDHMALFLTGPGLLAYAMKATLGHPLSVPFEPGTVDRFDDELWLEITNTERDSPAGRELTQRLKRSAAGAGTVSSSVVIPGRTKLLERTTGDMGETRYTDIDQNLIVAGTDIPDGYDTKDKDEHYSQTRDAKKVWGLEKVYKDLESANEQIQIHLVVSSKTTTK